MVDFRDDELKKWLAEEYEREIDEMEKVLFPDGVLPDDGETEEEAKAAYQKLVARLKADGVYEEDEEDKKFFGRKSKVVPMTQQSQAIKMVISQPTTFEQSEEICSLLKEKKSVIVNLEYVSKEVARRIVDFISGGVYALDGHIQKISNSIFLIAPMNYEITNEMAREEIKNKLSVSWLKNNNIN